MQWTNGTFTCDACHATTAGVKTGVVDVTNYAWDGTTQSKINDVPTTGEFVTVGHGVAANGGWPAPAATTARCRTTSRPG